MACALYSNKTSFTLRTIVHLYNRRRWDVTSFLHEWFTSPSDVLCFLHERRALICGDNVLRFFHGCPDFARPLNICSTYDTVEDLANELKRQRYDHVLSPTGLPVDFRESLHGLVGLSSARNQAFRAERSTSTSDLQAYCFLFRRRPASPLSRITRRFVTLSLARCEPYRYALAQHSTAFTGYISRYYALHPFPYSTMISHRTFVIVGDHVFDTTKVGRQGTYTLYSGGMPQVTFEIIPGIPLSEDIYPESVHGRRYLGDHQCWVIAHEILTGPFNHGFDVDGPCFEVIDFRARIHRPGSYLYIGEPFVGRPPGLTTYHLTNPLYHILKAESMPFSLQDNNNRLLRGALYLIRVRGAILHLLTLRNSHIDCQKHPATRDPSPSKERPFTFHSTISRAQNAIVTGTLFATGLKRPTLVELPGSPDDSPCEYLHLDDVFPYGALSLRVVSLPGTRIPLPHHYRIYFSNFSNAAPLNECLFSMFGIPWPGNVVIVRYVLSDNTHNVHVDTCHGEAPLYWNKFYLSRRTDFPFKSILLCLCVYRCFSLPVYLFTDPRWLREIIGRDVYKTAVEGAALV
ncbi:hypothetical protein BKA70DRAFT_1118899 [Coprinopsis sp. MPI-PUGE-AT-0042]|nr:hypothetical protein BKA70DRAFT_1118899 [Coprinopsis sp. MPI-PUGE-AT-0042]